MAQAYRSISSIGNVSTATLTINKPAGVVAGDLLVFAAQSGNGAIPFNTLAGWVKLHDLAPNAAYTHQVFYRQALVEPASYSWTRSGAAGGAGIMLAVSGGSDLIDAQASVINATSVNSIIGPDITTTRTSQMLIWIASRTTLVVAGGIVNPTNLTNAVNANCGAGTNTSQIGIASAIFPNAQITSAPWRSGSFSGGQSSRSAVSLMAFKDWFSSNPLQFCEV